MGCKGCSKRQNNKLNTYDWLCDVPDAEGSTDFVEVQFIVLPFAATFAAHVATSFI